MRVAITARLKNGALWQAAETMGGVKRLAEHLGVRYETLIAWMNFSLYPAINNPKSIYDWPDIEKKLLELTGLLLTEIFPPELKSNQPTSRKLSIVKEVTMEQLSGLREVPLLVPAFDETIDNELLASKINHVLKSLTPREEKIIKMRFGLDGQPESTLDEVADYFNVTRERIRQIEAKAMRKLRHPCRSRSLKRIHNGDFKPIAIYRALPLADPSFDDVFAKTRNAEQCFVYDCENAPIEKGLCLSHLQLYGGCHDYRGISLYEVRCVHCGKRTSQSNWKCELSGCTNTAIFLGIEEIGNGGTLHHQGTGDHAEGQS